MSEAFQDATGPSPAPVDAEVERFWAQARDGARLATLPGYLPAGSVEMVPPPTWSFGPDADGEELLALVLSGAKTATSSDLAAYGADEPLPEVGVLSIILDAAGHPRVLEETTAVEVVAFDQVSADHARLEGEGDLSLDHWREVHERFFRAGGHFTPDMPVVLERFRVRYTA